MIERENSRGAYVNKYYEDRLPGYLQHERGSQGIRHTTIRIFNDGIPWNQRLMG